MKLSVCLIVKNEEETLPRLLPCVKQFADEIVIVDTGSNDRTRSIIRDYADMWDLFPFRNDFAAARNHAFSLATGDRLMWLDADDVIPEASIAGLLGYKKESPPFDAVYLPYCTAFDEDGNPTFRFWRERIVKRSANPIWVGRVHETLSFTGTSGKMEIPIHHASVKKSYTTRNLDIYRDMEKNKEFFSPRDLFYFGRELYYHGYYEEALRKLKQVLIEPGAWIEDRVSAGRFAAAAEEALQHPADALALLYSLFAFSPIRPDIACDIGRICFRRKDYRGAIAWYRAALFLPLPENGFVSLDAAGYTPAIGLCLAYDKLGEREKASVYNDLAGLYHPNNQAYLYNRSYFQGIGIAQVMDPLHILLSEA